MTLIQETLVPAFGARAVRRPAATVVTTAVALLAAGAAPLLAPTQASAAGPLVLDGFDRSMSSGWGTAPTGGSWTGLIGGSGTSVAGGEGRVSGVKGGRSFRAYQAAVKAVDAEVRAEFTVPVAKNFQYAVEARKQADASAYVGRARIDPQGRLHLDVLRKNAGRQTMLKEMTLDVPVRVGERLVVELSVRGTAPVVAQGKAYGAGSAEPGWQVTALDRAAGALTKAGHTGVDVYNGGGNAAVTVRTQSFGVTRAAAPALTRDPAPASSPGKLATRRGAGPVGSAAYPVPADALFVAPSGRDTNPGTKAAPLRTLAKALTRNRSGQTIVLRGGTYHESVVVAPGHAATIQPYPKEAVWFDGTRAVTGFTRSGSGFAAPWNVAFDSSPSYRRGAPDGTAPGWRWLNPSHPMAAHPDMVWLGGAEQRQVKTLADLKPGTFFVDTARQRLHLGSNPAGTTVRAADLQTAFSLRAPGTVLRGFGIRRYADSVWQQGVVTSYYQRMTLDNLTVLDSATGGIGMFNSHAVVRNTTVDGSGQVGIHANRADDLLLDNVSVTDSNDERFNPAPSAGGIKITTSRGVILRNSEIRRTFGNQFWTDQSVHDITLVGNEIIGGTRWGVVLEISSTATVVDNVIAGNAYDGIAVQNTDKVRIWNNTIVGNRRAISFTQDSRRITQLDVAGHDPRRPQPDRSMPWVIGNSTVANNVLAAGRGADAVLAVESYELAFDASRLNIATNGNVYAQTALGVPNATTVWARKGAQPYRFVLLEDYRSNTGQERTGLNTLTPTPVDGAYRLRSSIAGRAGAVAQPLPADLADRVGRPTGTRQLGAWSRPVA